MAVFQNFVITAYRNGSPVKIQAGSFQRAYGDGAMRWQFTTIEPLDDLDIDTDVWSLSFQLSGSQWQRFSNAKADSYSLTESFQTGGVTVKGVQELATKEILDFTIPKTLVFINGDWATQQFGNWFIDNLGVMQMRPPHYLFDPLLYNLAVIQRIFHPRLPPKEMEIGTFQCIVIGSASHHTIAKYIAGMIDYDLVVTTPDIPLLDTFTVNSGTSFYDAILANFQMWRPDVKIDPKEDGGGTIQILDILNASGKITTTQTISVPNSAITSIDVTGSSGREKGNKIDHCIVIGRCGQETPLVQYGPDLTVVEIPEISLSPNFVVTNDVSFDKVIPFKQMGEFEGDFGGIGSEQYTPTKLSKIAITMKYYKYHDRSGGTQYVPIEEVRESIDITGTPYARTQTLHYYGSGYVPVRTVVKEYLLTKVPGQSTRSKVLIKVDIKKQDQVVRGTKQALSTEITEEKVIYDSVTKQGQQYSVDPIGFGSLKRIDRGRDAIDTDRKTTQRMTEMTTKYKKTMISRIATDSMIKQDVTFDAITQALDCNTSVLQNPQKDEPMYGKDLPFRREYFHGTPKIVNGFEARRNSITIKHDDISTEEIAKALSDRVFACRGEEMIVVKITTPVPIPIGTLPITVNLTSVPKKVNTTVEGSVVLTNATGGANTGTYYAIDVSESFRINDQSVQAGNEPAGDTLTKPDPLEFVQVLTLRSSI